MDDYCGGCTARYFLGNQEVTYNCYGTKVPEVYPQNPNVNPLGFGYASPQNTVNVAFDLPCPNGVPVRNKQSTVSFVRLHVGIKL